MSAAPIHREQRRRRSKKALGRAQSHRIRYVVRLDGRIELGTEQGSGVWPRGLVRSALFEGIPKGTGGRVRALGLGTLVIALLAVTALLDRETGVEIWLELRGDLASSTNRVDLLIAQNDSLLREIELLEADPTAIDRAIREELDLALPGEVVFRFRPSRRANSANPSSPEDGSSSSFD
jgi:cell division protein FtsB